MDFILNLNNHKNLRSIIPPSANTCTQPFSELQSTEIQAFNGWVKFAEGDKKAVILPILYSKFERVLLLLLPGYRQHFR